MVAWSARILAAGLCVLVLAIGTRPGGASPLIELRQKQMREIADAAKLIAEMFEARRPYDGVRMLKAAETIREISGATLAEAFPDGTFEKPSSALPSVAAEREAFVAIAADLARLSGALATAVLRSPEVLGDDMKMGSDIVSMNPLFAARRKKAERDTTGVPAEHLFHMIVQTCTSCHAKFRQRKE